MDGRAATSKVILRLSEAKQKGGYHLERRKNRAFLVQDMDSIFQAAQQQYSEENTNRRFLDALLNATRYAITNELTQRQRDCFCMRYLEGLPVREIGSALGLCDSTVSRHLRNARAHIQRHARYCAFGFHRAPDSNAPERANRAEKRSVKKLS